jgi:hypothetical protein
VGIVKLRSSPNVFVNLVNKGLDILFVILIERDESDDSKRAGSDDDMSIAFKS